MEIRKPELILVRGLPGSGKSTLAQKFLKFRHIEADMFWGPDYNFDINRIIEAHVWCIKTTESVLVYGYNAVVSNTFITLDEMEPYFKLAYDYCQGITVLEAQMSFDSVHDVPGSRLESMRRRYQHDITPLYKKYFG